MERSYIILHIALLMRAYRCEENLDILKNTMATSFMNNADVPEMTSKTTFEWRTITVPCAATCGGGFRQQRTMCVNSNTGLGVKENHCATAAKPRSKRISCTLPACQKKISPIGRSSNWYHWENKFHPCSKSCLSRMPESRPYCVGQDKQRVADTNCVGIRKPPVIKKRCYHGICPARWDVGLFGPCSAHCGNGFMRREVQCLKVNAHDDTMELVTHSLCPKPMPKSKQKCGGEHCPDRWEFGDYDECSVTCGSGIQRRHVYCVSLVNGSSVTSSTGTNCSHPPPSTSKKCRPRGCVRVSKTPVILVENYTIIQVRRARRVRLTVGGNVILIPGQSLTIRCPVKKFHRKLIFWSHEGKIIPMSGRIRTTFRGDLKMRRTDSKVDFGRYTCIAGGKVADIEVRFHSRKEAARKKRQMDYYLKEQLFSAFVVANTEDNKFLEAYRDGAYNITKRLTFVARDWSKCTATCDWGYQVRQVTCMRVSDRFLKMLPDKYCRNVGLKMPQATRKCLVSLGCPRWRTSKWSKCSIVNCVREGFALRYRKLNCISTNGTTAVSASCGIDQLPTVSKFCQNRNCIPYWNISRWSMCRPFCGFEGKKFRIITCNWHKTGLPAWTACRLKPRPVTSKPCKLRPCQQPERLKPDCVNQSRLCALAPTFNICHQDYFRQRCCHSCTVLRLDEFYFRRHHV